MRGMSLWKLVVSAVMVGLAFGGAASATQRSAHGSDCERESAGHHSERQCERPCGRKSDVGPKERSRTHEDEHCAATLFAVGGVVSGLTGSSLTLSNLGGPALVVDRNGAFSFPTLLKSGARYGVTVYRQPVNPTQTCTVSSGAGTVGLSDVTSIRVSCASGYKLGGTVTGLTGAGLTISNGRGETLAVTRNGSFAFANRLATGDVFNVQITFPPQRPAQYCSLYNGSGAGTVVQSDVTTVVVVCEAPRSSPLFQVCDEPTCGGAPPVVLRVCPTGQPSCVPSRATTVVARVDGSRIDGQLLVVNMPNGQSLVLDSGSAQVVAYLAYIQHAPQVILASDADVTFSYYGVTPVWGGTTFMDFASILSSDPTADSVFYRHVSYDIGTAARDVHASTVGAVAAERLITGLGIHPVKAYFVPTELTSSGEGNFSFGGGVVTINYGNPPYIAALGGILNTSIPRFSHEYSHDLFTEILPAYAGDSSCFNEGVADALAFLSGYLPEVDFGPVGLRGLNFETDGCPAQTEIHDVGNCPLWHIKKAGLLTTSFAHGLFHPQHAYGFNSCTLTDIQTGNALLVLFTEAASGADVIPALDAAGIPHAASYAQALAALGY